MAILAGNAGSLKLGANTVLEIKNWKVDPKSDLKDSTSFGDTWKEQVLALKSWTASAEGSYDITDTNGQLALHTAALAGTSVTPKFYVDSTHYYSGTAFVNISISAPVDDIVKVSYSFEGSGALSYS
jgi:predicted secreted protein